MRRTQRPAARPRRGAALLQPIAAIRFTGRLRLANALDSLLQQSKGNTDEEDRSEHLDNHE
jgi:hypothetical protein